MKIKILAQFYAVLFALLPSVAWAQQTPQPIIQGGTSWRVWGTGQTEAQIYSDLIDTSGMASITISVQSPAVACGATVFVYGSGTKPPAGITGMSQLGVQDAAKVAGATVNNFSYEVGPLPPYIKLVGTGFAAGACTGTSIYAVLNPIATISFARGSTLAGTADTATYPVTVGGTRRNTGLDSTGYVTPLRMGVEGGVMVAGVYSGAAVELKVDQTGALYTAGGGSPSVGTASNVSLSANVSNTICSLTAGSIYRVSCSAAASYRTGAATPTAVATDSDLPASVLLDVKMGASDTCVAFISGSAATCKASLLTF